MEHVCPFVCFVILKDSQALTLTDFDIELTQWCNGMQRMTVHFFAVFYFYFLLYAFCRYMLLCSMIYSLIL